MTQKPEPIIMEPEAYQAWILDSYDHHPERLAGLSIVRPGQPARLALSLERDELIDALAKLEVE